MTDVSCCKHSTGYWHTQVASQHELPPTGSLIIFCLSTKEPATGYPDCAHSEVTGGVSSAAAFDNSSTQILLWPIRMCVHVLKIRVLFTQSN